MTRVSQSLRSTRPDVKYPMLSTRLQQLARELGSDARLPTVNELCSMLGTSRATLNETLCLLERQEVIYRKNGVGIFVSPRLFQENIYVLFEGSWLLSRGIAPFWGMLWGLLDQEARLRATIRPEHHLFQLTRYMEPDQMQEPAQIAPSENIVEMVEQNRLQGVISVSQPSALCNWFREQGVPCVTFAGGGPWRVELNHIELLRLAVERLVEQGCQHIGMWDWASERRDPQMAQRGARTEYDQYLRYFLGGHGLTLDIDLVKTHLDCRQQSSLPFSSTGSSQLTPQEQGYLLALDTFAADAVKKPDGLIIMNDLVTDGALAALLSLGVRLNSDLKIVTHGNTGTMLFFNQIKGLSVLDFDPAIVVQRMFAALDTLRTGDFPSSDLLRIAPRWRTSP